MGTPPGDEPEGRPGAPGGGPPADGRPRRGVSPWAGLGLGLQLGVSVTLAFFAGRWADARWGTTPWLMFLGVAVGFAAGIYLIVRSTTQHED